MRLLADGEAWALGCEGTSLDPRCPCITLAPEAHRRVLFIAMLVGCSPSSDFRAPRAPSRGLDEGTPLVRTVVDATWRATRATEDLAPTEPVDPTSSLEWPAPPASVGCVVRGTGDPFFDSCSPFMTVRGRGRDLAQVYRKGDLEFIWGIPSKETPTKDLWLHARGGGISITGFTKERVRFATRREQMVVKDHVWVKDQSPVVPRDADGSVRISIQDEVAGMSDIDAEMSCEALSFDPLSGSPVLRDSPDASTERRPARDRLTLFTQPSGTIVAKLQADSQGSLPLTLFLLETRGSHSQVSVETANARLEGWVATADLAGEPVGAGALGSRACVKGPHGASHYRTATVARESSIHLGKDAPEREALQELRIAAGTIVKLERQVLGFREIAVPSGVVPMDGDAFWLPEEALTTESELPAVDLR
jgi:hypothetical protein